jgi:hypothetical protein
LRGTGEMQMFGDGYERAQMPDIDHRFPPPNLRLMLLALRMNEHHSFTNTGARCFSC